MRMKKMYLQLGVIVAPVLLLLCSTVSHADSTDTAAGLDEEIQSLKQDIVALNRSLFMLEEELLFPANTQVAVFLSMDVGESKVSALKAVGEPLVVETQHMQ